MMTILPKFLEPAVQVRKQARCCFCNAEGEAMKRIQKATRSAACAETFMAVIIEAL
jgi:hypothetical protein